MSNCEITQHSRQLRKLYEALLVPDTYEYPKTEAEQKESALRMRTILEHNPLDVNAVLKLGDRPLLYYAVLQKNKFAVAELLRWGSLTDCVSNNKPLNDDFNQILNAIESTIELTLQLQKENQEQLSREYNARLDELYDMTLSQAEACEKGFFHLSTTLKNSEKEYMADVQSMIKDFASACASNAIPRINADQFCHRFFPKTIFYNIYILRGMNRFLNQYLTGKSDQHLHRLSDWIVQYDLEKKKRQCDANTLLQEFLGGKPTVLSSTQAKLDQLDEKLLIFIGKVKKKLHKYLPAYFEAYQKFFAEQTPFFRSENPSLDSVVLCEDSKIEAANIAYDTHIRNTFRQEVLSTCERFFSKELVADILENGNVLNRLSGIRNINMRDRTALGFSLRFALEMLSKHYLRVLNSVVELYLQACQRNATRIPLAIAARNAMRIFENHIPHDETLLKERKQRKALEVKRRQEAKKAADEQQCVDLKQTRALEMARQQKATIEKYRSEVLAAMNALNRGEKTTLLAILGNETLHKTLNELEVVSLAAKLHFTVRKTKKGHKISLLQEATSTHLGHKDRSEEADGHFIREFKAILVDLGIDQPAVERATQTAASAGM